MNKKSIFLIVAILVIAISALLLYNNGSNQYSEDELVEIQDKVFKELQKRDEFLVQHAYTSADENGELKVYIGVNEEAGLDYEAIKEEMYEFIGEPFPLELELIPFPTEPSISGIICDIKIGDENSNKGFFMELLVVNPNGEMGKSGSDASWISLYEDVEIIDDNELVLSLDDLKIGMMVDSYGRGMSLDSYPNQISSEKLIVYQDYKMPELRDQIDAETLKVKYESKNLSQGIPLIGRLGWSQEENFRNDLSVSLDMYPVEDSLMYFRIKDKDNEPYSYEGDLLISLKMNQEPIGNGYVIEAVYLPYYYEVEFLYYEDSIEFQLPIYSDKGWELETIVIDGDGKIRESEEGVEIGSPFLSATYKAVNSTDDYIVDENSYTLIDSTGDFPKIITHPSEEMKSYYDNFDHPYEEDYDPWSEMEVYYDDDQFLYITETRIDVYDMELKEWKCLLKDSSFYSREAEGKLKIYKSGLYGFVFDYNPETKKLEQKAIESDRYLNFGYWKGKYYHFWEYQTGETMGDGLVEFIDTNYVPVEIKGLDYHILDSYEIDKRTYFLEADTLQLKEIVDGSVVKTVIEKGVRINEQLGDYLVYSHYDKAYGLYLYNLSSGDKVILNDEEAFVNCLISAQYVGGVTVDNEVFVYSLEDKQLVMKYEPIENLMEYSNQKSYETDLEIEIYDQQLLIGLNDTVFVMDIQTLEIKDQFPGYNLLVTDKQEVFYTLFGDIIEYLPETKEHEPIDMGSYAFHLTDLGEYLVANEGADGPSTYFYHESNKNWLLDNYPESLDVDYIIFYRGTEYGSNMLVYDTQSKSFDIVDTASRFMEYSWDEEGITYRSEEVDWDDGVYKSEYTEWKTYTFEKSGSVFDINEPIESYRSYFRENVDKGFVKESEILDIYNGRLIIFARPLYNEGRWDEKGLEVFVYGDHGKYYSRRCKTFSVSPEVILSDFHLNENEDKFYVLYSEEGVEKVALFNMKGGMFSLGEMLNEEVTGDVKWTEDGSGIVME